MNGLPRVLFTGKVGEYYIMGMELMGPNLVDVSDRTRDNRMSCHSVAHIATQAIRILEDLHTVGFVHGDVKPENMVMGRPGGPNAKSLFLVDLGLATRTMAAYDQRPDEFRGTERYASAHAHLGRTASRRDDLESLYYSLVLLLVGSLPWQAIQGPHAGYDVCLKKMATSNDALTRELAPAFREFGEVVTALRFDEVPNYAALIAMFVPLCVDTHDKRKWTLVTPAKAHKIARRGHPEMQWITVHNQAPPTCAPSHAREGTQVGTQVEKQRCHINLTSIRLEELIAQGRGDGFMVSSLACTDDDKWSAVLDGPGVTGHNDQVCTHAIASSDETAVPKDWLVEHWDRGYYVTSVACAPNGGVMIVMSKGPVVPYTQQTFAVARAFPYKWITKKWAQGFQITAMSASSTSLAASRQRWLLFMSCGTHIIKQCIELDFMYPSEGVRRRWSAGYRVTSCAATAELTALVLSTFNTKPAYFMQEINRSPSFPEGGKEGTLIVAAAYGRTGYSQ